MQELFNDFYTEFFKILQTGDEEIAKKFLVKHVKELPEDLQEELIAGLIEEALAKELKDAQAVAEFQQQAIEALRALNATEKELEKKDKLLELKESV